MPEKKKQHYVPKGYFRLFSGDQTSIHSYGLSDGVTRFFIPIDGQCQKPYFYSKDKKIEDAFSAMENSQLSVLKRIKNDKTLASLTSEDWIHIYAFLGFQQIRTKLSKERAEELDQYMNENFLKPLIAASEEARKKGVTLDMLKKVRITNKSAFMQEIGVVLESCWLLGDLIPILLVNKTVDPFLFSDTPVIFYNRLFYKKKDIGNIGLQSAGLQIFCPLSNDLLLCLFDKDRYRLKDKGQYRSDTRLMDITQKSDVQNLNCLQIYAGASIIYSGKRRGVVKAKELHCNIGNIEKKLNEYRTQIVKNTDEEIVEQTMFFQPNINVCIDFSFLETMPTRGAIPIIRNLQMIEELEKRRTK